MQRNKFLEESRGMVLIKFGKYKGEYLYDVASSDPEYLTWMLEKLELPEDVRKVIEEAA